MLCISHFVLDLVTVLICLAMYTYVVPGLNLIIIIISKIITSHSYAMRARRWVYH